MAGLVSVGALSAAPMLRLSTSTVYATTAVGAAAADQSVEAYNTGDGALSLSLSVPASVPWLKATVGQARACTQTTAANTCIPLQFKFDTARLVQGTYSATVTVSDPNAIDAPQTVSVVVQVGASSPAVNAIDEVMTPGQTSEFPAFYGICFAPCYSTSTQDGGKWLSIAVYGFGTSGAPHTYTIHLAPPADLAPGTYTGNATLKPVGETLTFQVTMHLTTQPFAAPSRDHISVRLAQGGPPAAWPFVPAVTLMNRGPGTLSVSGVSATGGGISAAWDGTAVRVTADPASRPPGTYDDGAVTIQCNASNCPVRIPVTVEIVPQSGPLTYYRGVVDNATFSSAHPVAPGGIVALFGEQLTLASPIWSATLPLPSDLGGTIVRVNGAATPLFYASFGQIAFQLPSGTPAGTALVQVERDGQLGNTVSVDVVPRAPQIVVLTDASYGPLDAAHAAHPGDPLIIWAIGLGPTAPAVPDGAPAPANPPAIVTQVPEVDLSGRILAPGFAGLSPGSVAVYQVIVTLPADLRPGTAQVTLKLPGWQSNTMPVAIQ